MKHTLLNNILVYGFLFVPYLAPAQHKQLTSCKFDFGTGKPVAGYIPVTASSLYNKQIGYGFEEIAGLTSISRKGTDPLKDDFITGENPFFFSVTIPEGNYDVTVLTGDNEGTTEATIRVECRRMMVQKLITKKGQIITSRFTVNIRDSIIRPSEKMVRLKPREKNYLHWDNKLTIEFNGVHPKVNVIEIAKATNPITVFLAGNSTVVDQAEEPYAAWGQMIPSFFEPGSISVCNLAESGEALSSFLSERRLEKALSMMKRGDYLFIEFAHNDQKQRGPGIGAFTSYKNDLKTFIRETRKKGGIPVLVTSMHRRSFDSAGKIVHTLGDYPEAMRQAAREEKTALVDLNSLSRILYEAWGDTASIRAFVHYPANSFPGQDKALSDNTHFNPYGAYEIARCIAEGIKNELPALAKYLRKDLPPFNPAMPDPITSFYWPLSKKSASIKPDGN